MKQQSWHTAEWSDSDLAMLVLAPALAGQAPVLLDANPAALAFWRLPRDALLKKGLASLLADPAGVATKTWSVTSSALPDSGLTLLRIAPQQAMQPASEVRRLTWAMQAYARSSKALIRSDSLEEMANKVCDAIVAFDNYALAIIAMAEAAPALSVRPIAAAGRARGYADGLALSVDPELAEGQGPTGVAMRSGHPLFMRDALTDPVFAAWRDRARHYGLRSSVTVPIQVAQEVVGAIIVYAATPDAFSNSEVQIFQELGEELAFAMEVITNKQRLEEARRAQAQAEADLKEQQSEVARIARALTLGEFASTIAHEITQPLAAVITNVETGLRFMAAGADNGEKVKAALNRALRDADRAHHVVQHTRNFVKREDPNPELCAINPLIEGVIRYLAGDMQRAGIQVDFRQAADLQRVLARPVQLQQVLINLIINAKDALQPVVERLRRITITTRDHPEGGIVVSVSDNGSGMSAEASKRVFDHFFTSKQGGMGLGLALSRSIIESHGGHLWYEPLEPHGACFSFRLPAGESADRGKGTDHAG